jgi:transcriptional regulator with XRE-family HTH domain
VLSTLAEFKRERERRGLSLGEICERSGLDMELLSQLEEGRIPDPTVAVLLRYADAIGMRLRLSGEGSPASEAVNPRRVTIELDGQNWFEVESPAEGEEHFTPGNAHFRFRQDMPRILRDHARKITSGEFTEWKSEAEAKGKLSHCAQCGWELPPRLIAVRLDGWKWLEFEIPPDQGAGTFVTTMPAILDRVAGCIEAGEPPWDHGWVPFETVTRTEAASAPSQVEHSAKRRSG